MCDLKEKIQDPISEIAHTVRMFHHGDVLLLPHAHRTAQHRDRTRRGNSAFPFHFAFRIEDVHLVGAVDQTWSYFCGSAMLITFKFACKSIYSLGETSE